MNIALVTSLPQATASRLSDPDWCNKFHGAGWVPYFAEMLGEEGHTFLVGREAYSQSTGRVICEDLQKTGQGLVVDGWTPQVNFCLESPLYVPYFYDSLDYYSEYKHRLWFNGGTEVIKFPSFDIPLQPVPWDDRLFLCMISANKHYKMMGGCTPELAKLQLHDYRYAMVDQWFGKQDLYGKGWPGSVGKEIPDGRKLEVLQNYKFTFVIENVQMNNYITEKIFDAFACGVIPLYLGAPNVEDLIPRELFIDLRKFDGQKSLEGYLRGLDSDQCQHMIYRAQKWLTEEGRAWSYYSFAQRMFELATS